jgi:cysteine-rich repeat protein
MFGAATAFAGCAIEGDGSGGLPGSELRTTQGCTLTIGYWKTHPEAWPVSSLTLGNVAYSKDELLAILHQRVQGNGLVSLAHQLIGAKLNIAAGADGGAVIGDIAAADALIGDLVVPPMGSGFLRTSATSALNGALDGYNNGVTGPGHCDDDVPPPPPPPPPDPVCGDGVLQTSNGEECDDGNTADGDGCSSRCRLEIEEPPPPPADPICGNGIVEDGEQCDDGNDVPRDGCYRCQLDFSNPE